MTNMLITVRRTAILFVCSFIQLFAAVFKVIATGFEYCSKVLNDFSGRVLHELDDGMTEDVIEEIAEVDE